jgi:hypothetical protein
MQSLGQAGQNGTGPKSERALMAKDFSERRDVAHYAKVLWR